MYFLWKIYMLIKYRHGIGMFMRINKVDIKTAFCMLKATAITRVGENPYMDLNEFQTDYNKLIKYAKGR